jgi:hypothetical protein
MTTKEALKVARKSLFESRKKIDGDLTISRNGKINRYDDGDGSTFAQQYDEKILFQISDMANEPLTVFEAWDGIKALIEYDEVTRGFLGIEQELINIRTGILNEFGNFYPDAELKEATPDEINAIISECDMLMYESSEFWVQAFEHKGIRYVIAGDGELTSNGDYVLGQIV